MKKTITFLALFLTYFVQAQNYSLHFDDTDDFVEIASSPEFTQNNFTIEAWIKVEDYANSCPIFTKYNTNIGSLTYYFGVRSDGKMQITVYQSISINRNFVTTSIPISLNTWHHVAATFNNATSISKIYVDGLEIAGVPTTAGVFTTIQTNTIPVNIGSSTTVTGIRNFFKGKIDDVKFWSITRSQSDIQSTMNTELAGNETGLVSYWKFDNDNQTCDVYDCNVNENHGTREGTAGANNLPQYSSDIPAIINIACGASLTTCSLSTDNFASIDSFNVYPNPTSGEVFINLKRIFEATKVSVYNLLGVKVYEQNFSQQQDIGFNFKGESGTYIVKINSEEYEQNVMIVKY